MIPGEGVYLGTVGAGELNLLVNEHVTLKPVVGLQLWVWALSNMGDLEV